MKNSHSVWQRLVVAARQAAPHAVDEAAPYGFSTRVAALGLAAVERPSLRSSLNHFSLRALGFSLMLMIVSIVANYSSVTNVAEHEQESVVDPVEEVITLS